MNGKGCTVSNLMNTLYSVPSATHTRTIHYRLATLVRHGLVYSLTVKGFNYYFLSDKSKGILEDLHKAKK